MRHANTLDIEHTALVVIDVQDAFHNAIADFDEVATRIAVAVRGARLLGVPVVVTEQYPKGLGRTAGVIQESLDAGSEIIEKTAFSSCGAQKFIDRLEAAGARQILICGIEAHVCVNQTTHDLLARGLQVHLLTDCISARAERNKQAGLAKMFQSGALPSSVEMALFELLRDARHEQFKEIQKLVK